MARQESSEQPNKPSLSFDQILLILVELVVLHLQLYYFLLVAWCASGHVYSSKGSLDWFFLALVAQLALLLLFLVKVSHLFSLLAVFFLFKVCSLSKLLSTSSLIFAGWSVEASISLSSRLSM